MLSQIKSRRPPIRFNLLYLQNNEIYLMSLKAALTLGPSYQQVEGQLHLCSRSLFFEPENIIRPMIRVKYSCGLLLKMLKSIQVKKVHRFAYIRKSQAEIKELFSKGASVLSEYLQKEDPQKGKKQISFFAKLYQAKKTDREQQQKVGSFLFVKVPKVFIIYRKPISPYITQKTEESLVFDLKKCNKDKINRFLNLYFELTKNAQENKIIKSIIDAFTEEANQQILETFREDKIDVSSIFTCRRIVLQGVQHGQLILLKNKTVFRPLLNCPDFQQIQFSTREIKHIQKYRYLFQHNGIQLWLYNCDYSILLVLADQATRQNVFQRLKEGAEKLVNLNMSKITEKWANGQISNIDYLSFVNIIANRSFNDLSQYPIFPWVIHNYQIEFDLQNHEMYRDLTKPIGAINKHRLRKIKDLYQIQLKDKTLSNPPHLYPTHYSTPGYVSYYLIRKIPEFIVRLQNGVFSPPERIFRCIDSAYSMSMNSDADFKELTPQFYSFDNDFLVNSRKLQMGFDAEGEAIDDVLLPKWAENSQSFLIKMRAAFESDYVSSHLNDWVDLVFGYKQMGTPAITADNIFYYLTYQEHVKFDKNMSKMQKLALEVQASEFGQTPVQIFHQKHPLKKTRIVNMEHIPNIEDRKVLNSKLVALREFNENILEDIERQKYRFMRKIHELEEMLLKNKKEKARESQKMKELLAIDTQSLKSFQFRQYFQDQTQKDIYLRQLEELVRKRQQEHEEMRLIISGLKRQLIDENESINSQIDQNVKLEQDFFQDQQ